MLATLVVCDLLAIRRDTRVRAAYESLPHSFSHGQEAQDRAQSILSSTASLETSAMCKALRHV